MTGKMRSRRWSGTMSRSGLPASFAVLAIAFLFGFAARAQQPQQQGSPAKLEVPDNIASHPAPMQPIPFSHKLHIANGLRCQNCHTNPDPGNQMTFPAASTCMTCHVTVAKDRPSIMKLAEYAKSNEPIPWARVYQITPGVTWTHRAHLQAGLQCINCHGDVAQLDVMAQTTSVTAMGTCISCHQAHSAPTTCSTCHAWPKS